MCCRGLHSKKNTAGAAPAQSGTGISDTIPAVRSETKLQDGSSPSLTAASSIADFSSALDLPKLESRCIAKVGHGQCSCSVKRSAE